MRSLWACSILGNYRPLSTGKTRRTFLRLPRSVQLYFNVASKSGAHRGARPPAGRIIPRRIRQIYREDRAMHTCNSHHCRHDDSGSGRVVLFADPTRKWRLLAAGGYASVIVLCVSILRRPRQTAIVAVVRCRTPRIVSPNTRVEWPGVATGSSATITGDKITIHNVRNFFIGLHCWPPVGIVKWNWRRNETVL